MIDLENAKNSFNEKLDKQHAQHVAKLGEELRIMRAGLLRDFKRSLLPDSNCRAAELALSWRAPHSLIQPLVDMTNSARFQELDRAFITLFNLDTHYPINHLGYPTVYCERLEEFFAPIVEQMDISSEARNMELQNLIHKTEETAQEQGGGIFGYNLPGKGAYLNGWLFTFDTQLAPRQAFSFPDLAHRIYRTAIHEKLGHGFLSAYSALGQVKNRLGISQMEIARRFGLRSTDDPISSLRREQTALFYRTSQLLEEGWSTWLETYMGASIMKSSTHPRYNLQQVIDAIQSLPVDLPDCNEIQHSLLTAIVILFGDKDIPDETLLQAVLVFDFVDTGLDEFFEQKLGQPLRYAIGELMLIQAEANLGFQCVPYAVLLAANVTFDPVNMGLADLRELLCHDPRLNPDVRLAALSRLKLNPRNDVHVLVRQAAAELSFSIPVELK